VLRVDAPPGQLATLQVVTDVSSARVEAVDCGARTVTLGELQAPGTYALGSQVHDRDWEGLRVGDAVNAQIRLELTVYIPPHGVDLDSHPPAARVLSVDPSFRILMLQYPDGSAETFKVALHAPLGEVVPGAWVDIHPLAVGSLALRGRRRPAGEAGGCMTARSPP
jgi:hypothetical protein